MLADILGASSKTYLGISLLSENYVNHWMLFTHTIWFQCKTICFLGRKLKLPIDGWCPSQRRCITKWYSLNSVKIAITAMCCCAMANHIRSAISMNAIKWWPLFQPNFTPQNIRFIMQIVPYWIHKSNWKNIVWRHKLYQWHTNRKFV